MRSRLPGHSRLSEHHRPQKRKARSTLIRLSVSRENNVHGPGERRFSGRLVLQVAAGGGEVSPWRPGLLSVADTTPGHEGPRRAAPNTHADSGGPAPQSRAAAFGRSPVALAPGSPFRA